MTSGGENKRSPKTLSWRAGLRGSDGDRSAPVSKEPYSLLWGEKEKPETPRGRVGRSWWEFVRGVGVGETRARLVPRAFQPECISSSEGLFCGPSYYASSVAHEKNNETDLKKRGNVSPVTDR